MNPFSAHRIIAFYCKPSLIIILCLGFVSGLPLALTASTLSVWLTESGVDKAAIGLFGAAATPYALKFLWAPLIDGARIPLLCDVFGRRRGWMLATQMLLAAAIALLAFADPGIDPWVTALAALFVAIFSASQDIVIDAYRVELLTPEEQGAGSAMIVLGYRLGMIVSGAGSLYLATYFGWFVTYLVMAALVGVGILTVLLAKEPALSQARPLPKEKKNASAWLQDYVIAPFKEFMARPQWATLLLFILLYKLGDAFIGQMTNPFFIELGFTKTQIASIVKLYGVIATIIGSFIGGWMVYRLGVMRSLWISGLLQMATNFMFMLQAQIGADTLFLATTISFENISGGMGTAAFVAFISQLANRHFTATQYALLSSFASFGRTWLSTPNGWLAEAAGWEWFFIISALLAIPGLVVLALLRKTSTTLPQAEAT